MALNMEIWRVPSGWSHPTNDAGYIPLYGQDYETVAKRWMRKSSIWCGSRSPEDSKKFFWEIVPPPQPEHYLPFESGNLNCYQIYDDQGMGLPQSPVFPDLESLRKWLITENGSSVDFAYTFSHYGFPKPSTVKDGTGYFHITDIFWVGELFQPGFILNGFVGFAYLSSEPTPKGINNSRVVDLYIRNPKSVLLPPLFSYQENGTNQKKPKFFDCLVTLLDNVVQTPADKITPWCAWSMTED